MHSRMHPGVVSFVLALLYSLVVKQKRTINEMMSHYQNTPEITAIEAQIQSWLHQNRYQFQLDLTNLPLKFEQMNSAPGIFSTTSDAPYNIYIQILFKNQNLNKNTTLEELRSSFDRVALDHIPLPGLYGIPTHWKISPRTPISSFSDGVTFEYYDPSTRILQLSIRTNFFAVSGEIPQRFPIMDAPAPRGTSFQVRQNFQGFIRLRAKLVFSK